MSVDRTPTAAIPVVVPTRRRPGGDRPTPVSTYRLQLGADLTFDDVADRVPYLQSLGVTHLYLSPVLQAAPGSTHGYDVVDHAAVSRELGGRDGLERLARTARERGLGIVLDIVPNHMAVPTPAWHNRALWSVLTHGPGSPYASWFDVDWSAGDGALLMPVLGARVGEVVASDQLSLEEATLPGDDGEDVTQTVLRYFDHVFPVRSGTESLPLAELVERQHYRLAYWKVADEELNYRRFFDVGTLAAIRVEDPEVFDASHELVVDLVRRGVVDGLRIDHPDGLADPAGYLERLAEATDHSWVAVEKILTAHEELPGDWETVGTTGYEGMWRLQAAFVDPAGEAPLAATMHRVTGDEADALEEVVAEAKREIVTGPLYAEVHRLTDLAAEVCRSDPRLRDHTWRALNECLRELLIAFDRYRAYVVPGREPRASAVSAMQAAAESARRRLAEERWPTLDVLVDLLLGREAGSAGRRGEPRRDELAVRFQQTCGAVMAKGVEDTAFYRWTHLTSLCEVGGEPGHFAVGSDELHAFYTRFQRLTPVAMTTGSTHDTKRNEDTRARLGVLSELPEDWAQMVYDLHLVSARYRSALVDGRAENLLWQTIAGTWSPEGPIAVERLADYLRKALREAKVRTTWVTPDDAYEDAVLTLARRALEDPAVLSLYERWAARTATAVRAASLGIKLIQLTGPGVADVYQGTEVFAPSLVDPDNRRPVDAEALAERLARLDETGNPKDLDDEKLVVTSRALRLRRELPEAFIGPEAGYLPLPTSSTHAFVFARTVGSQPRVVTVATRLAASLQRLGDWGEHSVTLPEGMWTDVLSGTTFEGGSRRIADLLERLPVALLRTEDR